MKLLLRIIANCIAILLATRYLPGFIFTGSLLNLFVAGAIIGLINALVKPIITLVALPVIFITFGLFNIIINIGLLYLADWLLNDLIIHGFWTAFWAVIIFSLTNSIISHISNHTDNKK
jgi:putative membrane protein